MALTIGFSQDPVRFQCRTRKSEEPRLIVQARTHSSDDTGAMEGKEDCGFDVTSRYLVLVHNNTVADSYKILDSLSSFPSACPASSSPTSSSLLECSPPVLRSAPQTPHILRYKFFPDPHAPPDNRHSFMANHKSIPERGHQQRQCQQIHPYLHLFDGEILFPCRLRLVHCGIRSQCPCPTTETRFARY